MYGQGEMDMEHELVGAAPSDAGQNGVCSVSSRRTGRALYCASALRQRMQNES